MRTMGRRIPTALRAAGRPPGQLTYAFIRGAAKQHGTLIFDSVCTFTDWGHKVPGDPAPSPTCTNGNDHGPTCGASYSVRHL